MLMFVWGLKLEKILKTVEAPRYVLGGILRAVSSAEKPACSRKDNTMSSSKQTDFLAEHLAAVTVRASESY